MDNATAECIDELWNSVSVLNEMILLLHDRITNLETGLGELYKVHGVEFETRKETLQ